VLDGEDMDPNFLAKLTEVRERGPNARPLATLGGRGCGAGDCVWKALTNVLPLLKANERDRLRDALPTNSCGLTDVLRLARHGKSGWWAKNVPPAQRTVDSVLELRRGLYIVAGNAHCVGVDANKQLVYDGAEVATLSPAALTHFGVVNDTRRVDIVCLNYDGERA